MDGEAARPRDAEIPLTDDRSAPKTGACATAAYPTDCLKRAFEFPILPGQLSKYLVIVNKGEEDVVLAFDRRAKDAGTIGGWLMESLAKVDEKTMNRLIHDLELNLNNAKNLPNSVLWKNFLVDKKANIIAMIKILD